MRPGTAGALSDVLQEKGFEKTRQPGTGKTAFRNLAIGRL
jgi:hypothetical protein